MKRLLLTLALAAALAGGFFEVVHGHGRAPRLRTAPVAAGDVVRAVVADGTLQVVDTVQVGAQVTGTVVEVDADFNDLVHKGQVLARFDPKPATADVERARAAVEQAKDDLGQAQLTLGDAVYKLDQARALAARNEIAPADLEAAEIAYREADAAVRAQQAVIAEAVAMLEQAQVDLTHTVITAPIDGLVIARNVEPGETVAAHLETPVLFQIASDLRGMQAVVSVDESDIGMVREGQPVTFTVDAYPGHNFRGTVEQVRAGADTSDNEVTYATVVRVENEDLKLRPGMTATARIEVARHPNVLGVPRSALRFVPPESVFRALGQAVPRDLDALSRPPRTLENATATIWILENGRLRPEKVQTGLSDGTTVEVAGGTIRNGMQVVTDAST